MDSLCTEFMLHVNPISRLAKTQDTYISPKDYFSWSWDCERLMQLQTNHSLRDHGQGNQYIELFLTKKNSPCLEKITIFIIHPSILSHFHVYYFLLVKLCLSLMLLLNFSPSQTECLLHRLKGVLCESVSQYLYSNSNTNNLHNMTMFYGPNN